MLAEVVEFETVKSGELVASSLRLSVGRTLAQLGQRVAFGFVMVGSGCRSRPSQVLAQRSRKGIF